MSFNFKLLKYIKEKKFESKNFILLNFNSKFNYLLLHIIIIFPENTILKKNLCIIEMYDKIYFVLFFDEVMPSICYQIIYFVSTWFLRACPTFQTFFTNDMFFTEIAKHYLSSNKNNFIFVCSYYVFLAY